MSHGAVLAANQALFATAAERSGWDISLVTPARWHNEYGSFTAQRHRLFLGEIMPVPVAGAGKVPLHLYTRSLHAIVQRLAPNAVYVHHEPYALATYQVTRAVRNLQMPLGFYAAQNVVRRYPWPVSRFEQAVFAHADFALPVSEPCLAVLRAKGYRGDASVLPLPVDLDAFPASVARPVRTLGLTIGFVGRLVPIKGLDVLFDALAGLPANVRAVIVGDGPDRRSYERRADKLGIADRVRWLGYVRHEDVSSVYREFDVLVVPSRPPLEQFGRVVVEAFAAGVPVVASEAGELPRLIRDSGGGWLFPVDDVAALRTTLAELHADGESLKARGERGRAYVVDVCSLASVADRFIEAVERAVVRRAS